MFGYLQLPLLQALFSILLIAIVLKGHPRSFVHRLFALFLLVFTFWGIVIFGMRASPDIEHAYSWEKCLIPVGAFMSTLFYHFSVRYTTTRIRRWTLPLLYLICLLFIPFSVTSLIISGMQIKPYGYAPIFGPVAPLWLLFMHGLLVMALIVFVRSYRRSSYAEERNRFAYIIAVLAIAFVGAAFDILPVLGLPLYPGAIIANIVFCVLVTVAIVRHRLLDIHIVLRKSIAYTLTSALIAVPLVGIVFLITSLLMQGRSPSWPYFVLILLVALGVSPLWQIVQRRVDRWFYRDRYDYLKSLETFGWQTQSLTDSDRLGSTMVSLVAGALRASSVLLLQPEPHRRDFATVCSSGVNESAAKIHLKRQSPLVKWLERSNGMLSYQDLDVIPQLQRVISQEKERLQQVGAELIAPLKARTGQLSGVLILGRKISEQPYTVEDKQLIYAISNQMITSLENARLYNDVQRVRESLETWLNSMSDCVMIVNSDYTIQFVNNTVIKHFGARPGGMCWGVVGKDEKCPDCPIQHYLRGSREGYQYCQHIGGREYDVAVAPLINPNGTTSLIAVLRDITERKRTEEQVLRQNALLNAINRVFREVIMCETEEELAKKCLAVAQELTGSKFGFMGEVNNRGRLDTVAISDPGWDICGVPRSKAVVMVKNMEIRGIRGEVIRNEKSLIFNNPASHPDWAGTPEGHPPITSFLGVPLKDAGKTIGEICLANKEGGYQPADQEDMESLSVAIVEAWKRKRVEEALRASEERFRNIYEESPIGIELYDSHGQLVDANKACLDMFGVSDVAEVRGFKLFEDPNLTDEIKERLRRGERVRYETLFDFEKVRQLELYTTAKSESIYIDVVVTPLCGGEKGIPSGYLVQAQDVTERKQMHDALQESEQNFRNSLESSPLGVRIVTAEGELLYANQAILDIYGYSSVEELKGVPVQQRYTSESYAEHEERKERRKLGKPVPSSYEISIVRKDGETRHLAVFRKEVIWNGETQFQALCQDITRQKQIEEALRLSEGFNSSLLSNSPTPVLVLNADASVRYVNPALEKLTGFSSAELVGRKPPFPWWIQGGCEECGKMLGKAMRGQKGKHEQLFANKNGEPFWVEITFKTVRVDGEFRYHFSNWIDLTERERLKENLEFYISQITRAQEEERRRIAREIHDDSVQSLATLTLDIDAMTKDKERLPEDIVQRLDRLRFETNSILEGLRLFSHQLRPGVIDEVGLVAALEILTEEMNREKIVNTSLQIAGSERRLAPEVELELFRIAQEALRNVRRHSEATKAVIRLKFARAKIRLTVSDNGRGFKLPEMLGNLASEGKLGLIGMQERTRLLSGRFLVTSQVGGGTTVAVEVKDIA